MTPPLVSVAINNHNYGRFLAEAIDSGTAIGELERMRGEGIRVLAIAWSAFWWLDFHTGFAAYLRSRYRCLLDTSYMQVFELRRRRGDG